jgi:hypothetical protein
MYEMPMNRIRKITCGFSENKFPLRFRHWLFTGKKFFMHPVSKIRKAGTQISVYAAGRPGTQSGFRLRKPAELNDILQTPLLTPPDSR